MQLPGHAKRLGNTTSGNVIMSRANPASCEDVIELLPAFIDGIYNRLFYIGDDPSLAQLHATFLIQERRQIGKVFVLRPTRKDLIPDNDQASGYRFFAHGVLISVPSMNRELFAAIATLFQINLTASEAAALIRKIKSVRLIHLIRFLFIVTVVTCWPFDAMSPDSHDRCAMVAEIQGK